MESRHSTSATPTGSPKRTGASDFTSSPSKRARPDGPAVDTKDDEFWYIDGTVVIRVHKTLFRVHASRLARYCLYFQKLFEACDSTGQHEIIDGCPVYHVPAELSANEFKDVLRALDTPLEFAASPPTQSLAISLLTASVHLVSPRVQDLAHRRLCERWDAARPPSPDPLDARKWSMAAYMVALARRHGVPGVLKRAFYELASSAAFWEAVRTNSESVRLPWKDVGMLYEARIALGKMWREWIMETEVKKEVGGGAGAAKEYRCTRYLGCANRTSWRDRVAEHGLLEKGAMDPLRYNVVRCAKEAFQGDYPWCQSCKAEKEETWRTKCVEWWGALDSLFGL
ncbi:hypothetical protein V8D89_007049 [Ganoderma adspersum]